MKEGNNKKLAVSGGIGLISSRLNIEGGYTGDDVPRFPVMMCH
jgi:hypothetical protein